MLSFTYQLRMQISVVLFQRIIEVILDTDQPILICRIVIIFIESVQIFLGHTPVSYLKRVADLRSWPAQFYKQLRDDERASMM